MINSPLLIVWRVFDYLIFQYHILPSWAWHPSRQYFSEKHLFYGSDNSRVKFYKIAVRDAEADALARREHTPLLISRSE